MGGNIIKKKKSYTTVYSAHKTNLYIAQLAFRTYLEFIYENALK